MNASAHPAADTPWYPVVRDLGDRLVQDGRGSVKAILLYGSHLLATNPDRYSAFDFVVVVDSYPDFYRALRDSGEISRWVWLMSAMSRVLPPNVIAYAPAESELGLAKCLIVSSNHLERALGPNPKDHFLLGRLVQKIGVVWVADSDTGSWITNLLEGAQGRVLEWMAPYLDQPVDAEGLGKRLLEVCYRGEVRPEAGNRAEKIYLAQAEHFREAFSPVLAEAERSGLMRRSGDGFVLATPVTPGQARRWRWHFRRSKVRSTSRWLKHTFTFDNWLPYVVRKAERHSGTRIELTALEKKWPLVFLWPRVIRFFRDRPPKEIAR